ncbi:hypothetical protein GCM10023175_60790 [Pseudonocardia xishanensis]|uniref:Luciferase-like monooxygenase n=1 Tax=Pseudonocardia xishanensis TaxID=630995 RepID=A0ABP8S0T7_9PSEU
MGGLRRDRKEAVDALAESVDVVRAMWSGKRAHDGRALLAGRVPPGPRPGPGSEPRRLQSVTLALTGSGADGWLPRMRISGWIGSVRPSAG